MDIKEKESFLREKIVPFIEREGFRVFEVKLFYNAGRLFLRILVDFENGGISLDDCALINRRVSAYLHEEYVLEESFVLEVFSPGLTRYLSGALDFLRVKEREVCVWLKDALEGRDYYEAKLLDVDKDKETVVLGTGSKTFTIPICNIRKAKQKIV